MSRLVVTPSVHAEQCCEQHVPRRHRPGVADVDAGTGSGVTHRGVASRHDRLVGADPVLADGGGRDDSRAGGGQARRGGLDERGVRAGQHECFDRLVIDFDGEPGFYWVGYVDAVTSEGSSEVVPLRGGARLAVSLGASAPGYDPETGEPSYVPAHPTQLVNVTGWRTFRQGAWAGSVGGFTSLGLGVRARLPFRVMLLEGPGDGSRVVVDVAQRW